jgi:uncharacterized membrane protein YbhN (UPF0104 family)
MQRIIARRMAIGGLGLAVVALVTHLVGADAQVLRTVRVLGRLRPETIAVSMAGSITAALLSGVIWWRLIARFGHAVPFRTALFAYVSAGLGGYVVNAAGPVLGCAMSLRRHGVCPTRAVLLTLIANALGFCGVLVWAPVGLLLLSRTGMDRALPLLGRHGPTVAALLLGGISVVMLVVLRALVGAPGMGNRLIRRLLRRLPNTSAHTQTPRYRHVLGLIPWSAGSWLAGALPLYVLLRAMHPAGDFTLGDVIGSAALATALGSLAFFVPEGMGVSDGALVALLTHATGLPVSTCAAAAIALRALDPLTKLSLFFGLALTAHPLAARSLARVRAHARMRRPQRVHAPAAAAPRLVWRSSGEDVRATEI